LTETLPYTLYTISTHLSGSFTVELEKQGLTISMYRVLAALLERESQRLGELSDMVFIELSTLSRLVGAMKLRGLVSRRRQQGDERSVTINLTDEGRVLLEQMIPWAQHYEKIAIGTIGLDKIETLRETLALMLENIADHRASTFETLGIRPERSARPKPALRPGRKRSARA
jgi:DNA-binding MarR family transcriptional regulator